MKKIILSLFLVAGFSGHANAQFGLPSLGGSKSAGGEDAGVLIAKFNAQNYLISSAVSYSMEQIIAAMGDKELIAKEKERFENIQKTTDPQEKAKKEGALIKETAVEVQKILDASDAKQKMQNLSPEMQQKVVKSFITVLAAGFQVPGMIDTGKKAIQSVGNNPMQLPKILPIKDGITMFVESFPKALTIAQTGFKLAQDVKIKAEAPTANTEIKDSKENPFSG
jgi:hypothetical protein